VTLRDHLAMPQLALAEARAGMQEGGIPIGSALFGGLIRQFGIPTVVVGESRTFTGRIDSLRESGIQVIDCDSQECMDVLAEFIERSPEVRNQDIGA
jgi:tRNA(Arg) A34 adenosine deaminase TadA